MARTQWLKFLRLLKTHIQCFAANFAAFIKQLNVETIPTQMSLSVSRNNGSFEWAGNSLGGLLAQKSNILRPWFWRMVFDVLRFNFFAADYIRNCLSSNPDERRELGNETETIGQFLQRRKYSEQFRDNYLVPMMAATWCTDPGAFSSTFPVSALIPFM